ncbi:heat shock factor protein 1 isoform X1 [Fundulus heteroclitus]|uniref:heat shock factor protein 1 isoform X1 n=1 Tax=Fundulus heteroclitus TaxID=8078 RepID=UPI00165ADE62|nr:heat shock factor protein 1 isoform X1 [Fundulus heteroclitus]
MEFLGVGGGAGAVVVSGGNVPAFLTKLWTLVEDPETDPLICWSPSGTSFHVFDQGRFSKEVLPKFFKHNNMASFIRQLNMYGFRKVVHIEQGGLVKPEKDDTEFQHPFFVRGQEHLLENIKRKVTNVSSVRQEEMKMSTHEVNKILSDVQLMKGKQETIDSRIIAMKHENEALWREVASLRQKHAQQQKVVNKLIHFLVSLVQTNRIIGVKRKIPLMLNDSSSAHSMPKYSRPLTLEHIQNAAANLLSADSSLNSGPIISDITEEAPSSPEEAVTDWNDLEENNVVFIKEEPASPEVEECPVLEVEPDSLPANEDTPLSPTTFINSILQDETPPPQVTSSTTTATTTNPTAATPTAVKSPASSSPDQAAPAPKSPAPAASSDPASAPSPATPRQKCQTIARLDRYLPPPPAGGLPPDVWRILSKLPEKYELSDHVDTIDTGLENLQSILNAQTFTFDPSPLMEFFGSSVPSADFDIESLDNLLSDEVPKESEDRTGKRSFLPFGPSVGPGFAFVAVTISSLIGAGKQLVQYTATPLHLSEPVTLGEGDADLPSLLEYETEPLFNSDAATDDPPDVLLSTTQLDSNL